MGPSLDCCECFVAMKRPKPFLRQRGSPNPNKHQTNTHTHTQPLQPASPKPKSQHNSHRNHKHTHTHTHTSQSSPGHTHTHTEIQQPTAQARPITATENQNQSSPHPQQPHTHTGAAAHIPSIGQTRHTSTPATFPQQKLKFLPSAANHTVLLEQITHLNVQTKFLFRFTEPDLLHSCAQQLSSCTAYQGTDFQF